MKIAYVHGSPVPSQSANAVHVMKMCAALATEGLDVILFCPETKMKGDPFVMYGVPRNFKICYIHSSGLLMKIPFLKSLSIAYSTSFAVKRYPIDVVYGRSTLAIYFLRKYKPFIYESHMLPPNRFRSFCEHRLYCSEKLIKHVVITDGLKQDYLSEIPFSDSNKLVVLQDAADIARPVTDKVIPKEKSKELIIDKRPVIGYLGHLYPGKCMEILCQVARMRPQYVFHVVGGKQEWVERWKNDKRCKDLDNIKFYGYVDNVTIPYYYSLFEICLFPFSSRIIVGDFKNSNIGRWTSPLKLFEAMSYGRPILTTNLPTIQEVLTDGVNCLMETESNIEGWCNKLDLLIADRNLRDKLGESARLLFESTYTWKIRAQKIIGLFKA